MANPVDQRDELLLVAGLDEEAQMIDVEALAEVLAGGRDQQVNECAPVVKMLSFLSGRGIPSRADGDGRDAASITFGLTHLCRQGAESVEDVFRQCVRQPGQAAADGEIEGLIETGQNVRFERRIVQVRRRDRNELAPLIAPLQHGCDQTLTVGETGIAMQQKMLQGEAQGSVFAAKLHEGTARGFHKEWPSVFCRGQRTGRAGEDGERARNVRADGVDGANVEAPGIFQQVPAQAAVLLESCQRERTREAVEWLRGLRA